MTIGCGAKFSKFILFTFNIVMWLAGLTLFIAGMVFLLRSDISIIRDRMGGTSTSLRIITWLLIVAGVVTIVITFAGCCGAIRNSECLLILYAFFLGLILAGAVGLSIYTQMRKEPTAVALEGIFNDSMIKYPPPQNFNNSTDEKSRGIVDLIQATVMNCCGLTNAEDWKQQPFYTQQPRNSELKNVPPSCCTNIPDYDKYEEAAYAACSASKDKIRAKGCKESIKTWVEKNFPILFGIFIGLAVVALFGVILSICLISGIRREAEMQTLRERG